MSSTFTFKAGIQRFLEKFMKDSKQDPNPDTKIIIPDPQH